MSWSRSSRSVTKWSRRLIVSLAGCGLSVVGMAAAGTAPAGAATSLNWATSQSNNWSGYNVGILSKGSPITSVAANWTVPTASAHQAGQAEYSAMWIGIGGGCIDPSCTVTDETLIQLGTEQDVNTDGSTSYSAWWETIPAPSVSTSITIHPGDQIHAAITQSTIPETWNMTIQDLTDGQSFTGLTSLPLPYPSDYTTGEFIVETPVVTSTSGAGIGTMPNLSGANFDLATLNGAPAGFTSAEGIQLVNSSGAVEATPSAPDSDTDGFAVCTYSSSCSAPGS